MTEKNKLAAYPIDQIRAQFPAYSNSNNLPPVYLDNPAGTLVPQRVIDAVCNAMASASHNLGGFFAGSKQAEQIWLDAHQSMAEMLGAASEREIVIAQSTTSLTLHLSRSIGKLFQPGDEIIVTKMDHEGNVSPWLLMAEDLGLTVKWLPFNRDTWRIEPKDLTELLSDRTRLLALNYSSNLTGSVNDVEQLTAIAKQAGALVYVDAVQLVPHRLPSVYELGCDFLVCSSYKFFGPHLGILWGRESVLEELRAYKVRCASNELPGRFETGTSQTEMLAGLSATVGYLEWLGKLNGFQGSRREMILGAYYSFEAYEDVLMRHLIEGLKNMSGVTIHGITNPDELHNRVPTISFTHTKISTHVIAKGLAERDIYAWSGHNYAYELVRHLGLNEDEGVIRLGISHYNDAEDIERTLTAVLEIIESFDADKTQL